MGRRKAGPGSWELFLQADLISLRSGLMGVGRWPAASRRRGGIHLPATKERRNAVGQAVL